MRPNLRTQRGSLVRSGCRVLAAVICAHIAGLAATSFAAPVPAPTGLVAAARSPTRIDLTWEDNSDNESVFVIERREAAAGEWTVAWALNNASFPSFSDMGLTPAVAYEYRVKARTKAGGESPCSAAATARTPAGKSVFKNLLRDRRTGAGTFQWRKVPPYQAVDGTQWTRWWSKLSPENMPRVDWLWVDMGSRQAVDKIRIVWQRDWWARKYEIQISDDAQNWRCVAAVENPKFQSIEVRHFPAASGRYLRFEGIESANTQKTWGGYGSYSLYEFEAYAPGVEPDPLEFESSAMNRPATATTRPEQAAAAVDGHLGTFWSAKHGRENSLTVDLGELRSVHEIVPYWHVPVDAYSLQLSADGETWVTVANERTVTRTPVQNEELREIHRASLRPSQRARHVRVTVTGRAIATDPNFAQIILQELLVHSTPAAAVDSPAGARLSLER